MVSEALVNATELDGILAKNETKRTYFRSGSVFIRWGYYGFDCFFLKEICKRGMVLQMDERNDIIFYESLGTRFLVLKIGFPNDSGLMFSVPHVRE